MGGLIDYSRIPKREILCIDVKSFFASVEAVRRGLDPLTAMIAVVSDTRRPGAVVLASSPLVKKFHGIKTGSRQFEIPPDKGIQVVNPSMALYLQQNQQIQNIFRQYVPDEDWHVYSIDESLLDVTGSLRLFGTAETIAAKIQEEVKQYLGLVVACGIGDNPLLAKLALDHEAKKQPPWIARWGYQDVQKKVWKIHPLSDFWGIARGYEKRLRRIGIGSIEALAMTHPKILQKEFGVMGLQLYHHAWGIDCTLLSEKVTPKSVSYSKNQMLMKDFTARDEILTVIHEMVDDVCARLRKYGKKCLEVDLGIGYSSSAGGSGWGAHARLLAPSNSTADIAEECRGLFLDRWDGRPVRVVNVSAGRIVDAEIEQLTLFSRVSKQEAIDATIDSIRKKFGKAAIFRAASMAGGTFLDRAGHVGGHQGWNKVD